MPSSDPLERVVLAVATFRAVDSVVALLEPLAELPFGQIVVVDSLADGRLEDLIRRRGWRVRYENASTNLGSAGNLARRLQTAASTSCQFAFAINHDGTVGPETIRSLVRVADQVPRPLGAIYPLRRYVHRGGSLRSASQGGAFHRSGAQPRTKFTRTAWSSSNGALYALAPVRKAVLPEARLWMGWEDLGYGAALESGGYAQYVANQVVMDDPYEYVLKRIGPWQRYITQKPTWYQYYSVRNLILLAQNEPRLRKVAFQKIAVELGMVALLRDQKLERLGLAARGLLDGALQRSGKWVKP